MKRPYRITLSSILAIGIALGGFYTGYAKNGPGIPQGVTEVEPTYVDKLPINLNYTLAITHPNDFGITTEEVAKIRKACQPALTEYFAAQRGEYERRLTHARLAEEGKVMSGTGRVGVTSIAELKKNDEAQKPMTQAWVKLSVDAANAIGKTKNAKIVEKLQHYRDWENEPERFDILFELDTMNSLGLSQVQRNQFMLLTACIANAINNGKAPSDLPVEFDQVAPKIDEYRKTVQNGGRIFKGFFFNSAVDLLSPLQKFRFETMVRNRQYVKP